MIRRQGFTLIELLIVVTIIAILAGAAVPYVQDYVDQARTSRAKADIDEIKRALMLYEVQYGQYDKSDIASLVGPFLTRNLPDPWGNAYVVDDNKSTVYSHGPDGVSVTTLEQADDVSAEYRPRMAVTRVNFVDIDGDGVPSANDILSVKLCRPLESSSMSTGNVSVINSEGSAVATVSAISKVSSYLAQFTLGNVSENMTLSTTKLRISSGNALTDESGVTFKEEARPDTLKIFFE